MVCASVCCRFDLTPPVAMLVTAWVGQAEEVDPGHDGSVAVGHHTNEVGGIAEADDEPDGCRPVKTKTH